MLTVELMLLPMEGWWCLSRVINTVYLVVSQGIMTLLCSLHCTVGSGVYIYLVFVMGSACRNTEVSLSVQLSVIDRELGLASYR